MDLQCFVFPGWEPRIRAAGAHRGWMDDAPESFPYRCLPLGIANSHGWEILCHRGFEVEWNGGMAATDVTIHPDPGGLAQDLPEALFGLGTFTIHVQGLIRTPPGWNLFVSGPPNAFKDGVAPLTGIIETDWSPYSFTMNWRLTRPHHRVRFDAGEPFAFFFPVQRNAVEAVAPAFVPIDDDPALKAAFVQWSQSRDAFQAHVAQTQPVRPADRWQKLYYRGLAPDGSCPVGDHKAKLRLAEFAHAEVIQPPARPAAAPASATPPTAPPFAGQADAQWALAKAEWLMETIARQQALSEPASSIYRVADLSPQEFLDDFFAPMRPVILTDCAAHWPACTLWTPDYLCAKLGAVEVEIQGGRSDDARFEIDKDRHRRRIAFDTLVRAAATGQGNDFYMTAYNASANVAATLPLQADLGTVPGILAHAPGDAAGMLWLGPAGTFTPLHHDLTNNLLVQLVGRKRVVMASPLETPKLSNHTHVFSAITNLTAPTLDATLHPRAHGLRLLDVVLEPGEALFLPVGWWHQVLSLDFSVSATYTDFVWQNEAWLDHPQRA
jgi:hypothetical protein